MKSDNKRIRREHVAGLIVERDTDGRYYVLDWDYDGFERVLLGPFNARMTAIDAALKW